MNKIANELIGVAKLLNGSVLDVSSKKISKPMLAMVEDIDKAIDSGSFESCKLDRITIFNWDIQICFKVDDEFKDDAKAVFIKNRHKIESIINPIVEKTLNKYTKTKIRNSWKEMYDNLKAGKGGFQLEIPIYF